MKPFDLSQYMFSLSQAAGAGLVGYNASQNYPAGSVGAAIKSLVVSGGVPSTMAGFDTACTDGDFVYQTKDAGLNNLRLSGYVSTPAQNATLLMTAGPTYNDDGASIALRGKTGSYNPWGIDFYAGGKTAASIDAANNFNFNGPLYQWAPAGVGLVHQLSSNVGKYRYTRYATDNSPRWDMGVTDEAESGGNAGTNFYINAFADNGSFLEQAFSINRATRQVNVGYGGLNVHGENIWVGDGKLLLQGLLAGDSYIRSYSGNLYLGWTNSNNVLVNGNGIRCDNRGAFMSSDGNQLLLKSGFDNTRTIIHRNDSSNYYILVSDPSGGDASTAWNTWRPFAINLSNGFLTLGTTVYHANDVWHSSLEGKSRFYYATNGATYAKVVGSFRWQNQSNNDVAWVDENGTFSGNGGALWADGLGNTATVQKRFLSGANITWNNPWTTLEIYGQEGNGASIAFHRPGQYGIYFGLDGDNVMRLGAWSSGVRWTSDTAGNMAAAGNIAAYSDERLKTNWRGVCPNFVEKLAEVRHGIYERTDVPITQCGVGAQSLREFLPEAVLVGDHDTLQVAYGNAALLSAVELAKKVVSLEARLAELEALIRR